MMNDDHDDDMMPGGPLMMMQLYSCTTDCSLGFSVWILHEYGICLMGGPDHEGYERRCTGFLNGILGIIHRFHCTFFQAFFSMDTTYIY